MKNIFYVTIACLVSLIITGCPDSNKSDKITSKSKLSIVVTIPPQKSIVQAIAGRINADITIMVPPGREPHDYQPTPKQVLALYNSDVYFEIGLPFEKTLLSKIQKKNIKTDFIDMCKNLIPQLTYINGKSTIDPHVWLSPVKLKILSTNTLNALVKLMPKRRTYFKENYKAYIKKIDEVYKELTILLKPFRGETFFVFHPAFSYFATDFGLKQEAVEIEGKAPTPKELFNLIKKAKSKGVNIIFVEPQFSQKSAQALAEAIHGSVISINPLSENILSNLLDIAKKIKVSFLDLGNNNPQKI